MSDEQGPAVISKHPNGCFLFQQSARAAGFEPVTFRVTGGRSNQTELRPRRLLEYLC